MTTRLYLLRHGIAVPSGTPGLDDDDRPLTPKGAKRVKEIGGALKRLGVAPGKILSSPLPRAIQTATIVAEVLKREDAPETTDALVPRATAGTIRDWLVTRSEERLMLVGHNPNLTELLGLLIGLPEETLPFELKKGGVAELRAVEGGNHVFQLHWLATPRLLRKPRG